MDWRTKLLDPKPQARQDYASLATPVYRGSTVLFDGQAAVTDDWRQAENGYSYGLYGTPTTLGTGLANCRHRRRARDVYRTRWAGGNCADLSVLLPSWQSRAYCHILPMAPTRRWPKG